MRNKKLINFSWGILYGGVIYNFYRYLKLNRINQEFEKIEDKKIFFFNIHNQKNFYNETAISLKEKYYKIDKLRKSLLKFCEGKILETGVGLSRNIDYYSRDKSLDITAIDYSPNVLEQAISKVNLNNIKYELQDVENLSFKDNTFDTLVDTFSLEYYNSPEKAIKEMNRVVKNEGKILILTRGKSENKYLNYYNDLIEKENLLNKGYYLTKDMEKLIDSFEGFKILKKSFIKKGSIYLYVILNQKKIN